MPVQTKRIVTMDDKLRQKLHLDCLYEMFQDKVEENVVYIVYSENEGRIDATIDQLMSIASCSFTGHYFGPKDISNDGQSKVPVGLESGRGVIQPAAGGAKTGNSKQSIKSKTSYTKRVNTSSSTKKTESQKSDLLKDNSSEIADDDLSLDQRIDSLRESIDHLIQEKGSSHEKASQYLTRKMYPVTSYYTEVACQLNKMIESKTNQLVELLLEKCKDSDHIDLHGLNPIQARLVVNELVDIRQNKLLIDKQGEASIDIITGWGKHSLTQGQRIRPTILALLREKGLEYHHLNKGALRAIIRRLP